MAETRGGKHAPRPIGYELFIGALSVLSIANLIFYYVFANDETIELVIITINVVMFPIFMGDFIYRLLTSESRSHYFWRGFGWADLLSSLPLPQFKILRLFRLWRVVRLFRTYGARNLMRDFAQNRAENALLTVIFLVICVLEFGALAIIRVEQYAPNSNIKTASDGLWWTYVTITTVGYGDRYPVTNAGRIVGIFVMTAGVGLFGTLSGFLANKFLAPPKTQEKPADQTEPAQIAVADNTSASESLATETSASSLVDGVPTAAQPKTATPDAATEATDSAAPPVTPVISPEMRTEMEEFRQLIAAQEAATSELRNKLEQMLQQAG